MVGLVFEHVVTVERLGGVADTDVELGGAVVTRRGLAKTGLRFACCQKFGDAFGRKGRAVLLKGMCGAAVADRLKASGRTALDATAE